MMAYSLRELYETTIQAEREIRPGVWVPARPVTRQHLLVNRMRNAWLVLIGKADAVVWPEDAE